MIFTIIIPTYNRCESLVRCLDSVKSQDFRSFEIIVVDDGSTDRTGEFLSSCKSIRHVRIGHRGPGAARNAGIAIATGKYIAFTDDDCIADRGWLENLHKGFSQTTASAVGGRIINAHSGYVANASHILNFSKWEGLHPMKIDNMPTANIAYRKEALEKVRFDERFLAYEDSLLNMKLRSMGHKFRYNPSAIVHHHGVNNIKCLFAIQKKRAREFVKGGHLAHPRFGSMAMNYPLLGILGYRTFDCLRNCVRNKKTLNFIKHSALILAADFYWGLSVIKEISSQKTIFETRPRVNDIS